MAALLLGLRLRQLGRSLTRSPWHIVGLVFGVLGALWLLFLVGAGAVALRVGAPEAVPFVLVLVTSVAVVGWAVGAILTSADESLAPERFALLPVRARQLLPGLALAHLLGIGGIATALALALLLIAWSTQVATLVAAIVMLPIALVTCMLGARVVSGALAQTLASRRSRDVTAIVLMLLLICSGLIVSVAVQAITSSPSALGVLTDVATVLAWTPIGATAGVPAAIAGGDWIAAGVRLLVALATVALLWWAWGAQLAARLVAPVEASGGGRVRSGGIVDRLVPATPVGAIAARGVRFTRRDPRHLLNAIAVLVLPLILVGSQLIGGQALDPRLALFLPLVMALMVLQITQLSLAYDKDALALHVLAGVSGRADRAGRLLGAGVVLGPMVVAAPVVVAGITGGWDLLPAGLGAAVGTSLVAAGVGIAVGAFLPGRAPSPERPFGRGSSGGAQSLAALAIMAPITLVASAPAIALAIASVVWQPWLGWVAVAVGLAVGAVAIGLGIRIGGDRLDRTWPEVLAAVSSED
ncbi:hypothetical protein [Agrococcus sp. SGAir0287]|uniref:hypothetical protein n=1 Tax=Agrococcus sp. SGAir0287 TaxID=2070347 RepID=UPI0010CD56BD|nr:hypothetical protein [Agrococcus sp. SGAir0287]QCR18855.1 hypothetical protein C1N71_04825 [Agrococcus sp. SGAir0287]